MTDRETLTPELAHERERHDLMADETRRHASNVRAELKRHEAAMADIERVYTLRTGRDQDHD